MSAPDETAVQSAVFSFLESFQIENGCRTVLVAFSGGPDSTALLWALTRAVRARRRESHEPPRLVAAHLDHGLDAGSADRAAQAHRLALLLVLCESDLRMARLPPVGDDEAKGGIEDWARRKRYEFLHSVALDEGADVVVTAHHADDQAETVALRLLYGSGLRGMAGVRPTRSLDHRPSEAADDVRLVRPLLSVRRRDIEEALEVARAELPELTPLHDPTNADLRQPRSFVRHHLLDRLESRSPGAVESMVRVADAARRFCRRLDDRLDRWIDRHSEDPEPGLDARDSRFDFLLPPRRSVSLDAFLALPDELRRPVLGRLHLRLGHPFPPPESAVRELDRQLGVLQGQEADHGAATAAAGVGVDCGDSLHWSVDPVPSGTASASPALILERRIPKRPFTYTFDTPGAAFVPEIFASLHCRPWESDPNSAGDAPPPWMLRGEVLRAGLSLPADSRPVATVRSRRPGDRLRPLGASGSRKLKDLLIDRKVPRTVRDRLPLLFLDGILAWVPGVTVDESFRLDAGAPGKLWIAEIRPARADEATDEGRGSECFR